VKLIALAFTAVALYAQTARVIPIDNADAYKLKQAQEDIDKATAAYDTLVKRIERDYLIVNDRDPDKGNTVAEYPYSITGTSSSKCCATLLVIGNSSGSIRPSDDPCDASYESVACLEKRLLEARQKAAAGKKPEPRPVYLYWRSGFENGYSFTKDFRFVVPKPPMLSTPDRWGTYLNLPLVAR
jgi:hypothetical protein